MNRLLWLLLVVASSALAESAEPLTFCVMGDVPYAPAEELLLTRQLAELPEQAAFVVHLGDIKAGGSPCEEGVFKTVAGMLAKSPRPLFIVPGDNEWNDCQNPDKAWILWQRYFLKFDERWQHSFRVARQPSRAENFAFLHQGGLFVGLNMVGGKVHDASEWRTRHAANLAWLKQQLTEHGDKATHLVLFAHAKPFPVHNDFFAGFEQVAQQFARPVLLLHGDGHQWIHDHPFAAKNVLRVQVDAGGLAPPLLVTLSDNAQQPFQLDRRNGLLPSDGPAKKPAPNHPVTRQTTIRPSPRLPDTAPWNLATLAQSPAFEWVNSTDRVRALLYDGEPYAGKPTRVFAYYATPGSLAGDPSQDKNLPAVVLVHGGGGTAFRDWVELWAKRGYAAIAMDLAGSRPIEGTNAHQRENRTRLSVGGPGQGDDTKFGNIAGAVTEQWPYHAVANVIRAHSLIGSFPEVDAARTAITGISWGGYLTCIVAGVDTRFKAAVPVYGCGYLHENSVWLPQFANMAPDDRQRWITLWDPSRYLPAVSMPILFINGTNDNAYPLDSYMKSFDAVPREKQIRITVNMPHGHPPGWAPEEIGLFIDHQLRGGKALPVVGEPRVEAGHLRVTCDDSKVKLREAALHYTSDHIAINKRNWQTLPATIEGNVVVAAGLPADATAWFITVTDERGAIVSSRVTIAGK